MEGDSAECDREVCSIVSGEDEDLKFLDVEPELHGAGCSCKQTNISAKGQASNGNSKAETTCELHSKYGGEDSGQHREHEPEIQRASQVAIEGIKEPTALINRLTAEGAQNVVTTGSDGGYCSSPGEGILAASKDENVAVLPGVTGFCKSTGTSGGSKSSSSDSHKSSASVSPSSTLSRGQNAGSGTTPSASSKERQFSGDTDHEIRLKLGGFSGRASRKGSNCSTPISATVRSEYDYPSTNFVRTPRSELANIVAQKNQALASGMSLSSQLSMEEGARLQIRLHYNPVMDEWVSLTDERLEDRDGEQSAAILFDLYKKAIVNNSSLNGGSGNGNSLDEEDAVAVGQFLKSLQTTGIRRTDPRLKPMMKKLNEILKERKLLGGTSAMDSLLLNRELFTEAIKDNHKLISRAFQSQFVVPEFGYFCKQIVNIYEKCKSNTSGKVAAYIPQLARYDPNYWAVSICTVSGQRFSVGNVNVPFTLQSCSKPFTYAVGLNELGADEVHRYVGQEPSGRMFNELTLDFNNKPNNPLLNSGAIMSSAILLNLVKPELKMSEKFDYVTDYLRKMAGGEFVGFNNSVFLSERETADRNFALAYYMKENDCFPKGFVLQDCLDFYFQTCSMEVNCETIAVMGATLANGGVCPITSEAALGPEAVRDVLSLMHSCGMYNYSGQFAFNVGLPAKSGVSGALVLVVPNVMGIGIWSPPLDALGNSVRGVQFSKELVKLFNFHRFDNLVTKQLKIDPRTFRDERNRQSTLCLLYSATTGDLTALKRFYYVDADMCACNYDRRTALHLAACEGHSDCVKFLVEKCKISPLVKDRWGFTPLEEAKRFQHDLVFRYLAKYVEDHYPKELEQILKEQEEIKKGKEENPKN